MLRHNDMYRRSVREPQNFITLGLALSRKCTASESSGTRPTAQVRIAAPTENTLEASEMRTPLYSGCETAIVPLLSALEGFYCKY